MMQCHKLSTAAPTCTIELTLMVASFESCRTQLWPGEDHTRWTTYRNSGARSYTHNDFLMHCSNAGLLGLAATLFLLAIVTWLFWRARGQRRLARARRSLRPGVNAALKVRRGSVLLSGSGLRSRYTIVLLSRRS